MLWRPALVFLTARGRGFCGGDPGHARPAGASIPTLNGAAQPTRAVRPANRRNRTKALLARRAASTSHRVFLTSNILFPTSHGSRWRRHHVQNLLIFEVKGVPDPLQAHFQNVLPKQYNTRIGASRAQPLSPNERLRSWKPHPQFVRFGDISVTKTPCSTGVLFPTFNW